MLYHLLLTPLLLGLLLAAWIGFQGWVRRMSPGLRADADVLRGRFSCGTCIEFESCHTALTRPSDSPSDPHVPPGGASDRSRTSVSDTNVPKVDRIHEVTL